MIVFRILAVVARYDRSVLEEMSMWGVFYVTRVLVADCVFAFMSDIGSRECKIVHGRLILTLAKDGTQ